MSQFPANGRLGAEYSHLFRLLHWVLTGGFAILIVTGLSLHAAARPDWSVFSGVVPWWLWRGRVHLWHYWASVVVTASLIAVLHVAGRRRFWRRPTHVILVGGGIASVISGLWILFGLGPAGAMKLMVAVHAGVGLIVLPAGFLWHAIEAFTKKYWPFLAPAFAPWRNPTWGRAAAFLLLVAAAAWVMAEGWPWRAPWRTLRARRVAAPAPAAPLDQLPWSDAPPLSVRLVNGAGFQSGQTIVTLRALHDGTYVYVEASWEDARDDRLYWPWRRTERGWEYLQTSGQDETVYYEDKFSLAFPIQPSWLFNQLGCAVYCHVDGQYGWGYKGGRPDIDVWHWKAARTQSAGQADDKYWSLPDFENDDVGRFGDPAEGGGYQKNVAEDAPSPAWLTTDLLAGIRRGAILNDEATPYSDEAAAAIEPDTLLPGLVCSPFEGDRGDVASEAVHRDGRWTVRMRRRLDTGSPHDATFEPGGVYAFGCAAFDHAAKRHAYNLPVLWLALDP